MRQTLAMGLVTEEDVDAAVAHLMMTRMRLGMFDKDCPFDAIPYEENDTPAHHTVALIAAEESMVLLKTTACCRWTQRPARRLPSSAPTLTRWKF